MIFHWLRAGPCGVTRGVPVLLSALADPGVPQSAVMNTPHSDRQSDALTVVDHQTSEGMVSAVLNIVAGVEQ